MRRFIGPGGKHHQPYPLSYDDNTAFINLDNKNVLNEEEKTFRYMWAIILN